MPINKPPTSQGDNEQLSYYDDELEDFSVESTAMLQANGSKNIKPPKDDVEQRLGSFTRGTTTSEFEFDATSYDENTDLEIIKLASVDEVANMALLKERRKRRLPFVCRIAYVILFHVVLLAFLIAATQAILDEGDTNESNETSSTKQTSPHFDYIHSLSDPSTFTDPKSAQSKAFEWIQTNYPDTDDSTPKPIILQHYVLAVFYYSLNGEDWRHNDRWLLNATSVCEWYTSHIYHGVSRICTADGFLQVLDLSSNELNGTLPTELGHLSEHLASIDLNLNHITGTIPSELSRLTKLQYLGLDANQLVGTVPSTLAQLPMLTELNIDGNNLEGEIPDELCDLFGHEYHDLQSIRADCDGGKITCDCACQCF